MCGSVATLSGKGVGSGVPVRLSETAPPASSSPDPAVGRAAVAEEAGASGGGSLPAFPSSLPTVGPVVAEDFGAKLGRLLYDPAVGADVLAWFERRADEAHSELALSFLCGEAATVSVTSGTERSRSAIRLSLLDEVAAEKLSAGELETLRCARLLPALARNLVLTGRFWAPRWHLLSDAETMVALWRNIRSCGTQGPEQWQPLYGVIASKLEALSEPGRCADPSLAVLLDNCECMSTLVSSAPSDWLRLHSPSLLRMSGVPLSLLLSMFVSYSRPLWEPELLASLAGGLDKWHIGGILGNRLYDPLVLRSIVGHRQRAIEPQLLVCLPRDVACLCLAYTESG